MIIPFLSRRSRFARFAQIRPESSGRRERAVGDHTRRRRWRSWDLEQLEQRVVLSTGLSPEREMAPTAHALNNIARSGLPSDQSGRLDQDIMWLASTTADPGAPGRMQIATSSAPHDVVFVDPTVPDYRLLLNSRIDAGHSDAEIG